MNQPLPSSAHVSLRERLGGDRLLLGFLQMHPHPVTTELAGLCGYDFIMLDCEHGLFDDHSIAGALQAAESGNASILVRVARPDPALVGRIADLGVDGLVVPGVRTVAQAEQVVSGLRYPPDGARGFGAAMHRASRYGLALADIAVALLPYLVLLIESAEGAVEVSKIASLSGVDALMVGPYDLSADVGQLGGFEAPAFIAALAAIEQATTYSGKVLGGTPFPGHSLSDLAGRGHRMLLIGSDVGVLRQGMIDQLREARSAVDH